MRRFATVDQQAKPEVGELTISSEALSADTYSMIQVDSVSVHFRDYDFGTKYISPEDLE